MVLYIYIELNIKELVEEHIWEGNDFGARTDPVPDGDDAGFQGLYLGWHCANRTAESWELSCHPAGPSIIANGLYAGHTLAEYAEKFGAQILGKNGAAFKVFPVLVKLIDANDNLSIQVHPDDTYALSHDHEYGKTEMWYIVDTAPGHSFSTASSGIYTRKSLPDASRRTLFSMCCTESM